MLALRWLLGIVFALFLAGFLTLAVIGRGFRESFGASPIAPLIVAAPVVSVALMTAALMLPTNRTLLHVAAASALALAALCLWQRFTDDATVMNWVLPVLAAWFYFYWRSL